MTSIPGVDYAWSHPGGAALQRAGKKFACRYLSTDASKNLSRAEADDLAAHGVSSVVVWETTAKRPLDGRSAGVYDAQRAESQAKSCGMPSGRPIYFAVDFDATPSQQDEINAYLDGAASIIGRDRTGIYGGYYPVKRALDAGKARWAWQTIAWSGGQWDPRAVIRQGAQTTINGVSCDLNTATATDYGQWTPGKAPQEDDPMAGMTPKQIADAVLNTDGVFGIPASWRTANPENSEWKFSAVIVNLGEHVRAVEAELKAMRATVDKLADALGKAGSFDPEALKAEIRQAIESVTVRLDVPDA